MNINKRFARRFMKSITNSLFVDGFIDESDLKSKSILFKKIKKLISNKSEFQIVTDHTETILSIAEEYSENEQYEYSKIFYALFIEHSTNSLINSKCKGWKISQKSISEILRLGLEQKLTWLLEILKLPKYKPENLTIIKKLSDDRNAFVHYKYKSEQMHTIPDIEKAAKENQNQIRDIRMCIKYHKAYITKTLYKGNKQKIVKLLALN